MNNGLLRGLVLVGVALVFSTCDDDSVSSDAPSVSYILGDLVHFDTIDYTIVERIRANEDYYALEEPFLCYEKSLGEPFYDLDGDGVYTVGIDLFIITVSAPHEDSLFINCGSLTDTTCLPPYEIVNDTSLGWDRVYRYTYRNQDLNYNGRYDDPDDDWIPGCPFDDWSGDGQFQQEMYGGSCYHDAYEPGCPFGDLNGNGEYDSVMDHAYFFTRWDVDGGEGGQEMDAYIHSSPPAPSAYRFVSDSGLVYDLTVSGGCGLAFSIDTAGFWRTGSLPDNLQIFTGSQVQRERGKEYVFHDYGPGYEAYQARSIFVNQALEIDSQTFTGLVRVDLEYNNVYMGDTTRAVAHYWFQPNELHLLAVLESPLGDTTLQTWYYLHRRLDAESLPFPASR